MNPHRFTASAAAAMTLLLGSCAVGPNFKAPQAPHTAGFVPAGALPAETSAAPEADVQAQRFIDGLDIPGQWWTLFRSAELNALIERGIANNPTLEAAQAALKQANETVAAQRGAFYPSVSAALAAQRVKEPAAALGLPASGSVLYTLNSAEVNVSYTLDAFGGVRRQVEALQAQAEYVKFSLEASYLSLTANIVTAAITDGSLRAQIAATEDIANSQQKQLDITRRRVSAGGASRADVLQQQALLQATLASLPLLRSQLAHTRNLLSTYVGSLPAEFSAAEFDLDTLTLPLELPVSLPSKFVEQRPDMRQYSALLHAATANVGVATANLLPQITLSGAYGS
jgi:NodT family efflux transporter outer membrane factor (OMF) lipoprotein